jgi:hypothetical protein
LGILHSQESVYAKERCKWEAQATEFGPGLRPFTYQPYPKMLSRAGRTAKGVPTIVEHQIADSDVQEANLLSRGFRDGEDTALELLHAEDRQHAILAANRAASDRTMSPRAHAEAAAIDDTTIEHLPVIPPTPIRPRARKKVRP